MSRAREPIIDAPRRPNLTGTIKHCCTPDDRDHRAASHFVMNGGNMLVLQRMLEHSTIAVTIRYAHLAPDHLREAIQFGPAPSLPEFFDSVAGAGKK
jgi:hypothetical protein